MQALPSPGSPSRKRSAAEMDVEGIEYVDSEHVDDVNGQNGDPDCPIGNTAKPIPEDPTLQRPVKRQRTAVGGFLSCMLSACSGAVRSAFVRPVPAEAASSTTHSTMPGLEGLVSREPSVTAGQVRAQGHTHVGLEPKLYFFITAAGFSITGHC